MTMQTPVRTQEQLREHYQIEKELADRLRNATKVERRQLYNTVYDERLQRIPHHPLVTKAVDPAAQRRAVLPQLRLLQPFLKPESVFLEIGPGDCALALAVAQQVKQVYAVDVSDGLMQEATPPPNFSLSLSDGTGVPVPASSVDLAYSNQVMEHLHPEDAAAQVAEIYKALAPGGRYLCVTPNRLSGPWDISRQFDAVATGLHLKEYTLTELADLFRANGFVQVHIFLSYHGYHLSPLCPVPPFSLLEWGLARLPRATGRRLAHLLTAAKVIATK